MDKEIVTLSVEISKQRVSDLLVSAFEGGSNSWYLIEIFDAPTDAKEAASEFRHATYPISTDGGVWVSNAKEERRGSKDYKSVRVGWQRCKEALRIMSEKYPRHFANWREENDDADTGDCFLQCCVFGEMIYG